MRTRQDIETALKLIAEAGEKVADEKTRELLAVGVEPLRWVLGEGDFEQFEGLLGDLALGTPVCSAP